jgi:phenylalanine-4-hydroxylase
MGVVERTVLPKAASPDWAIPQGFDLYSEAEHQTWTTLYERQAEILPGRACEAFLHGLEALDLHGHGIPDFQQLNEKLLELTGWRVVAVPGLVPDAVFFEHLANRRFPAANFIRGAGELDYLQEPDIFHDVFGHVPMLTDPVFADYMQAYGKGGLRALSLGSLANLARLYWYTVEFGLLETSAGLRIYGAGIVSSRTESIFALASDSPNRLGFDLERVMRTLYRIDDFQQVYFVIPSLQHLLDVTTGTDFGPLYHKISHMPDIPIAAIEPGDKVFTRGTQDYARSGGRVRQGAA